jgi:hypothetical protein
VVRIAVPDTSILTDALRIIANLPEFTHAQGVAFTSEEDAVNYYMALVELIEAIAARGIDRKYIASVIQFDADLIGGLAEDIEGQEVWKDNALLQGMSVSARDAERSLLNLLKSL